MEKDDKIRSVEREIDNEYRKYKLYHLQNRPLAQWYLLLMHEESVRLPIIKKTAEKIPLDWFEIVCSFETSKASLQFSLKWTDELPDQKFHIPKTIDWEIYEYAHDFFSLAENYYRVIAPFTLYSRGLAGATIEDEFTIRFSRDLREAAFDFLGLYKTQDPAGCLKSYTKPPNVLEKEIDNILMSAKPLDKQGITYKVNHKNLAPLIAYFLEEINKRTYLTDEWSIRGISATELKSFFQV
jgi:hypothetical protein